MFWRKLNIFLDVFRSGWGVRPPLLCDGRVETEVVSYRDLFILDLDRGQVTTRFTRVGRTGYKEVK